MTLYRLRMWTGPTAVQHFAELGRKAGFIDVLEGTEHIHFDYAGADARDACQRAREGYERIHGQNFPLSINPVGGW